MKKHCLMMALLACQGWTGHSLAQNKPAEDVPAVPARRVVPCGIDSGPAAHSGLVHGDEVVFETLVLVPDAAWLRLRFASVDLAPGAFLRIESLLDGGTQILDRESAAQWGNTSCYLNGDAVVVELVSPAGVGPSRVVVGDATAGGAAGSSRSPCGPDDRVLSSDPRSARYEPTGCTAWLFNDFNRMFLTAAHCEVGATGVVEFNVPLSTQGGTSVHPPPEDQYAVEPASVQSAYAGIGTDWAYFGVYPNSNTGLTPWQRQGQAFVLAPVVPDMAGQTVRVTGYGVITASMPVTWNHAQTTCAGAYMGRAGTVLSHRADTTRGDSGAAILDESTGLAIGIHTDSACQPGGGGANKGSSLDAPGLRGALASPRGVCGSGLGPVEGPLFIAGDLANNFGTLRLSDGKFGRLEQMPARIEGLAYNRNRRVFYAIDRDNRLYTIDAGSSSGDAVTPGVIVSGTDLSINGLAYDPGNDVLYGVAGSNGQLVVISTSSGVASPRGTPAGGGVSALDYDYRTRTLFGIVDSASGSRLVRINPDGSRVTLGALGVGISDCNGLAYNDRDGFLYTVDAVDGRLLRVNPGTGAATAVGFSGGVFGASYGMACEQLSACAADFTQDGVVDFSDYLEFLSLFDQGDSRVDFSGDGIVDFSDYLEFLSLFDAGC